MKRLKFRLYWWLLNIIEMLFFGYNYREERAYVSKNVETMELEDPKVIKITNKYPIDHPFIIGLGYQVILNQRKKKRNETSK